MKKSFLITILILITMIMFCSSKESTSPIEPDNDFTPPITGSLVANVTGNVEFRFNSSSADAIFFEEDEAIMILGIDKKLTIQ